MNRHELNEFLKRHTLMEEYSLHSDKDILSKVGNTFDDTVKKFPIFDSKIYMDRILNASEHRGIEKIPHPDDGVMFSVHPRFSETTSHHHDYIELMYVYSGECQQVINGREVISRQGELIIMDTNVSHSIARAEEDDIIINCMISKKYFDRILMGRLTETNLLLDFFIKSIYQGSSHNDYILFHSRKSEKLTIFMEEILCEYFEKSICAQEIINSYLVLILSELFLGYEKEFNNKAEEFKNNKISNIIQYIQDNCKDATLTGVAEYFHFNPYYLSALIKKVTGKTFTEILQEAKLKKACILLKNSEISISEISAELGYENTKFLYKVFSKYYNCTPKEYRSTLQKLPPQK